MMKHHWIKLDELRLRSWGRSHYFDASTMRFFNSRLCDDASLVRRDDGTEVIYCVMSNRCTLGETPFPREYLAVRIEMEETSWKVETMDRFRTRRSALGCRDRAVNAELLGQRPAR